MILAYRGRRAAITISRLQYRHEPVPCAGRRRRRWPPFFGEVRETGAHRQSIAPIVMGEADIAAIDAVTYAAVVGAEPELTASLRIIATTAEAATPPFVTSRNTGIETVAALRMALADVAADPGLADVRKALFLRDIVPASVELYAPLRTYEVDAARAGYPDLADPERYPVHAIHHDGPERVAPRRTALRSDRRLRSPSRSAQIGLDAGLDGAGRSVIPVRPRACARKGGLTTVAVAVFVPQGARDPASIADAGREAVARDAAIHAIADRNPERAAFARTPADVRGIVASGQGRGGRKPAERLAVGRRSRRVRPLGTHGVSASSASSMPGIISSPTVHGLRFNSGIGWSSMAACSAGAGGGEAAQ